MSYELHYLVGPERRPPGLRALQHALHLMGQLHREPRQDRDFQVYVYRNPHTGVECTFVAYEPEEDGDAGLTFCLEVPRPTVFALETLPLAVQVARELRLLVEPPGPFLDEGPVEPTVEILFRWWKAINRQAIAERAQRGEPPPWCSEAALESMWEYQMLHPDLCRRYRRRGVAVPEMGLLRLKRTGEVVRWASWKDLGPSVIPPADWIFLDNPPPPLKHGTLIPLAQLLPGARRWIKAASQPMHHRVYLEENPPAEMLELLQGLKGRTMRSFEPLKLHEVVDEPISPPSQKKPRRRRAA